MKSLLRGSRTPIGIDVGSHCVKAMQLSRTRQGWRVDAATQFAQQKPDSPVDRDMARRIVGVLGRQGFEGHDVVLAVPSDQLQVGILELPPRDSGAPIEQIARIELARAIKTSPDALSVDMWDVPAPARAAAGTHVMAVALRHADADAIIDAFENEGMNVCGLDIPAWALARACIPHTHAGPNATAVLDIGWNGVLLALVHQSRVIYQRALVECGLATLRASIAEALELEETLADHVLWQVALRPPSDGERTDPMLWATTRTHLNKFITAMTAELETSFSYAAHQYPHYAVETLYLTGGGAAILDLPQQLSTALGIAVNLLVPAELAECRPMMLPACRSPALVQALGLAQYGEG